MKLYKSVLGSTLFETALVLPALLFILLAASDVSRMMHAHTVVNEAAEYAARCVYPIDGECNRAEAATADAYYNWYDVTVDADYFVNEYNYSGTALPLYMPVYRYDLLARVIDTVSYQQAYPGWIGERTTYRVNATEPYVVRNEALAYPIVTVSGSLRNWSVNRSPQVTAFLGQGRYRSNPNISLRDCGLKGTGVNQYRSCTATVSATSRLVIGEVPINLTAPAGAVTAQRCLVDNANLVVNPSGAARGDACSATWQDNLNPYEPEHSIGNNVVIGVTASTQGSSGPGNAYLRVNEYDAANNLIRTQDLNGQALPTGAANANFYLRGHFRDIKVHQYRNNGVGQDRGIFLYYRGSNGVARTTLEVSVAADSAANPVELEVRSVEVWHPRYETRQHSFECPQRMSMGEISSLSIEACDRTFEGRVSELSNLVSINPIAGSEEVTQTRIREPELSLAQQSVSNPAEYTWVQGTLEDTDILTTNQVTQDCGENPGVTPNLAPAAYRTALINTCDINDPALSPAPITATTAVETIGSDHIWQQVCGQNGPTLEDLSLSTNYLDHYFKQTATEPENHIPTGNVPPVEFIAANPEYSCGRRPVMQIQNSEHEELRGTAFFGATVDLGCDWESELSSQLVSSEMVEAGTYFAGVKGAAVGRVQVNEQPTDSCIPYSSSGEITNRTHLGEYISGNAPAECQGNDNCQRVFSRYDLSEESGGDLGGIESDYALAATKYGMQELKAGLPAAQADCEGANCARVEVFDNGDETITSLASFKVPLTILGNTPVEISSTVTHNLEQKHIKRRRNTE